MKTRYIFFLLLLLLGRPPGAWAQTLTTYQAEAARPVAATVGTGATGYTGSGFVENITTQGQSSLTFTVTVPTAGAYNLDARYAAAFANQVRTLGVWVNGTRVAQAQFPGTGAWNAWATQTAAVTLNAGTNTIRYFYDYGDSGWVNLDYLVVRSAPYEAATAQLTSANASSSYAGYTGSGFAENITQAGASAVTFSVSAPAAGPYGLKVRYAAAEATERTMSVYVNGTDVTQARFSSTAAWDKWAEQAVVVTLQAGTNSISYRYDADDNGRINMDYLQVIPLAAIATNNWQSASNDYSVSIDSMTQHLDRSRVATGILYDRVLPLAMLPSFSQGAQPDTASAGYFYQAYLELRNAAYTATAFPLTLPQLRAKGRQFLRHDSVALAVLDYKVNYLDTLAVYDNLLLETNRLYYDVASPPRSPYLTASVTVAAALVDTIQAATTFYVPQDLLLTNGSRRVSSLQVDFGDGAGLVTCRPGQPRIVSYSQSGRKIIAYTVFFTDGTQRQCRSSLYAKPDLSITSRSSLPLLLENITAQESFAGYDGSPALFGTGEVLVVLHNAQSQDEYRANPSTYKLRKPLIILDGFDPQDGSGLSNIRNPASFYQVVQQAGILTAADQLERDVILLNFPNSPRRQLNGALTPYNVDGGSDYIERNALVLVTLINQLKPRLASPSEKFAIIGPSMGGLISRYALAYMEKRQYALTSAGQPASPQWDHNTALWLSLDAPHQGANVPIGAQEFLRYFQDYSQSAQEKFDTRLNTPAAKQMLLHHHSAGTYNVLGAPGFRDRFMLALRDNGRPNSLGYPELLRRVAITNGRLDGGAQGAAAGSGVPCGTALQMDKVVKVFSIFRSLFFYRKAKKGAAAIGDINFSPSNSTCDIFKGQVDGLIKILVGKGPRKRISTTRSTTGSYDLAPGGWYNTQQQIVDGSSDDSSTSYANVKPNHCFIPTVSGLGYQYKNMASYQSTASLPNAYASLIGRSLSCSDETPFDAYYGASNNIQHIVGQDAGTSSFLGRELANVSETPAFVSAQTQLCPNTSATFALPAYCGRFPITYTWTLSGNLRFAGGQISASGVSQVVYSTNIGTGQITIVASQQGLAPSAPLVYQVTVSAPEVAGTYSTQSGGYQPLVTVNQVPEGRITINITSPVADCNFSTSSTNFIITKTGPKSAYFTMGPYSNSNLQGVSVTVTPTSGCFKPVAASKRQVLSLPSLLAIG